MLPDDQKVDSNGKPSKIRVVLVDDHPLLRQAIRTSMEQEPDFEIIGEAEDGEAAVSLASRLSPDVVIMDIGMPGMNGLEATRLIKAKNPEIKVLILTVHDDTEHIIGIFEAGADGYLTKKIFGKELLQAVRAQAAGETVISPQIFKQLFKHAVRHPAKPVAVNAGDNLTVREMEILKLLAKGKSNKDIASELNVSLRTIKSHLIDIFNKLKVSSRTEAVVTALRARILTLSDLE